ncbi:MAG: proline dehydrogenase family protein [candidate division KSB1 bacterium]|nr:proline dehydrogenase family protein [candidate division KSB1 bacterium]MDZ7365576.1 proline dehydrogenase family protein [candidate division KSB1 bacterium]MDZ7403678.1 proline dehydrogenase family protein [candidate division KSB1 bacterium]
MILARNALLWISENRELRQTLPRYKFIRRAVSRFMPGEELADAMQAAEALKEKNITAIFTRLGENVADAAETQEVKNHYLDALQQIQQHRLDAYISIKPTQLGLDFDEELCFKNLTAIVELAAALQNWVWIDMEQSGYVDRTLALFKKIRRNYPKVGLCVQAYLYRTQKDLEALLPLSPAIRLVKGAYMEPANVAYPKKRDVDDNFFALAKMLLAKVKTNGVTLGVATHDKILIKKIQQAAAAQGLSKNDYEFQFLYGIQTDEQLRLAAEGYRMRVLISYGSYWFPWYMRRLAERPANILFVLKNLLS